MVYDMPIYTVEYTAKPESDCGCEWKQSVFGQESQKEPGYGIFHVNEAEDGPEFLKGQEKMMTDSHKYTYPPHKK